MSSLCQYCEQGRHYNCLNFLSDDDPCTCDTCAQIAEDVEQDKEEENG